MNSSSTYFYLVIFIFLVYYLIEIILKLKFSKQMWGISELPNRWNIIEYFKFWKAKLKDQLVSSTLKFLIILWLVFYIIIILCVLALLLIILIALLK
jgi:hypothetical protein